MIIRNTQPNIFDSDVIIYGGLSALSGARFTNTIFTTTSALSVVNTGIGPALFVSQSPGDYDIANFYDQDGLEVLHVGNAFNNNPGRIGINESFPSYELTVKGSISASRDIFANIYYAPSGHDDGGFRGGPGGYIDLRGGDADPGNYADGSKGGYIRMVGNTRNNAPHGAGYINTSAGLESNGGYIATHGKNGEGNHGGYIDTTGGYDGNFYTGGYICTRGGSGSSGGYIDTSIGGGSINTSNGGGSIDLSQDGGGSIIMRGGGTGNGSGYAGSIDTSANDDDASGGSINTSGGSVEGTDGGSINTSGGAEFGRPGGSINTSNGGGYINTSGDSGGQSGGYIDTSATNGGSSGGYINTTGSDGSGGFIDTRGKNNGYSGGSINTSAGDEGGGGSINTSGGVSGAGGSINTSNGGGSIITCSGLDGEGGGRGLGGSIDLQGGNGGTDGWGGSGGSIQMKGVNGDDGFGGSAGSIIMNGANHGGTAGSINTSGGYDTIGGSINTYGAPSPSSGINNGGSIDTFGGNEGPGGAINTSNGGGSINTRELGKIEFGVLSTRTTLSGSATTDRFQRLPDTDGILVADDGYGITTNGYKINTNAILTLDDTEYTLNSTYNGKIVVLDSTSETTITVPTSLPVGFNATFIQINTGQVVFTASGTTINSDGGKLKIASQHSAATLISYAPNVFNLAGNLTT